MKNSHLFKAPVVIWHEDKNMFPSYATMFSILAYPIPNGIQ